MALLVRQWNGSGDTGHIAVGGGGVTLSGGVLNQACVPRPEDLLGPVAEPYLQLSGQNDDELPSWSGMEIRKIPHLRFPKNDVGCIPGLGPFRSLGKVHRVYVGLTVAAVKPKGTHNISPKIKFVFPVPRLGSPKIARLQDAPGCRL
jgi:hypothetical protein